MLTPSGRFKPDYKICLSMSDFHPDSWNPAWSIATILTGLLSFMLEETETTGSIVTSLQNKQFLALQSMEWNRNRPIFRGIFL
jgi:ubiquitin-conjugating enzyme E2 J2